MVKNKSTNNNKTEWLNFALTPELAKRLNAYVLAVANKKGSLAKIRGIRAKIGRDALKKWLDENEENLELF